MFGFNKEAIVKVVIQLDLIEANDSNSNMPVSILMTAQGSCITGDDPGSYPIVYPNWEMMEFFMGSVDIEEYEAHEPCVDAVNLASTIAGPFAKC
jgi:hypothetical protein